MSLEERPKLSKQLICPMEFSRMKIGLIGSCGNLNHYIILGKGHNDWACSARNTFCFTAPLFVGNLHVN